MKRKPTAIPGLDKTKHKLRNAIMVDHGLTGKIRAVGWLIADRINIGVGMGYSFTPQVKIMAAIGCGEKTVERAKKELVGLGYFVVVNARSDGRADRYYPGIDYWPPNFQSQITDILTGILPVKMGETNRQKSRKIPVKTAPLSFLRYPEISLEDRPPAAVGAPDGADGLPEHGLGPGGELLKERIGEGAWKAWFLSARAGSFADGIVTVVVDTRFIKGRIERDYADAMLDCWRRIDPAIHRIAIVVREPDAPMETRPPPARAHAARGRR